MSAKLHYHVIDNVPGYMPESDPAVFTSRRAAESYAISVKRDYLDTNDWGLSENRYSASGSARSGCIAIDQPANEHYLGVVITINPCDDPACELANEE